MKYRVLYADPPWTFGDALPGKSRGASRNYGVLSALDIEKYPLPEMEENAILFMWRVAAMQEEALDVIRAWGFEPKSEIVWVKTTAPMRSQFLGPSKLQEEWRHFTLAFGMGRYVRASHETCLIATRGRYKVRSASERSILFAPRGEHSSKPAEMYSLIERLCEGPYAELFAREQGRNGWTSWGDQLEGRPASPAEGP